MTRGPYARKHGNHTKTGLITPELPLNPGQYAPVREFALPE
jgi:hypothetical protein